MRQGGMLDAPPVTLGAGGSGVAAGTRVGPPMDNQSAVSGAAQGTAVPEDFAVVMDAELRVMAWSAGARALLGHTPDDVVGRPAADLLAADLPHSAGRHLSAGEPWTSDVALRHGSSHGCAAPLCRPVRPARSGSSRAPR